MINDTLEDYLEFKDSFGDYNEQYYKDFINKMDSLLSVYNNYPKNFSNI